MSGGSKATAAPQVPLILYVSPPNRPDISVRPGASGARAVDMPGIVPCARLEAMDPNSFALVESPGFAARYALATALPPTVNVLLPADTGLSDGLVPISRLRPPPNVTSVM